MYRPSEVAKIANIKVAVVYRMIHTGTLPAVKPYGSHAWVAEPDVRKLAGLTDECMLPEPKTKFPLRQDAEAGPSAQTDGAGPATDALQGNT